MGVAKSDFSQMCRSDLDLIKNVERFARIDLDRSIFEKERNHLVRFLPLISCHQECHPTIRLSRYVQAPSKIILL